MVRRGRILRDTNSGPGVLSVDGRQYTFALEDMWRSEVPPRLGMMVNVNFDGEGAPSSVFAVPESEIMREQAQRARSRQTEGRYIAVLAPRRSTLIALSLLGAAWFLLVCVSIRHGHPPQLWRRPTRARRWARRTTHVLRARTSGLHRTALMAHGHGFDRRTYYYHMLSNRTLIRPRAASQGFSAMARPTSSSPARRSMSYTAPERNVRSPMAMSSNSQALPAQTTPQQTSCALQ